METLHSFIRFIRYLISWNVFTIAISTLLALPKMYNIPSLTPTVIFWAHKLTYFFFIDVFHGIILPLNVMIPWDLARSKVGEFYVRKPTIEPRRSTDEDIRIKLFSKRHEKTRTSLRHLDHPKIFEQRQRRFREDQAACIVEVQPSTSQTTSRPTTKSRQPFSLSPPPSPSPTSSKTLFRRVFQVDPATNSPEPLPKVFKREAGVESRQKGTIVYCRTCVAVSQRGKGGKTESECLSDFGEI